MWIKRLFFVLFTLFLTTGIADAGIPNVVSIIEVSTPTGGGGTYYDNGETISFETTFSEPVNIVGAPELQFQAAGSARTAPLATGTGTVAQFDYTVGGELVNDWDGITVAQFNLNPGESIKSVSTAEDLVPVNFDDVDFSSIRIDSDSPTVTNVTVSTTDGVVSGPTTYLRAGDILNTELFLLQDDTRRMASLEIRIGTEVRTWNYLGAELSGEFNSIQESTSSTFLDGANGALSVIQATWQDQAGKIISNTGILPVGNFFVDNTKPILGEVTPVTPSLGTDSTPDVTFSSTEAGDISFSGGCGSATTTATIGNNTITMTMLPDGTYNCSLTVTDVAGNVSDTLSLSTFEIDTTDPVFANIGVTSDNTFDTNYGNATSILTFTMNLAQVDSFSGTGQIDFSIGGTNRTIFFGAANQTANGSYSANYTLSGENGTITITDITFSDYLGHSLDKTLFTSGGMPSPTVIIDTQAPDLTSVSLASSNANPVWAKATDTMTYSIVFDEDVKRMLPPITPSTANNANLVILEVDLSDFGTSDQLIFQVQPGDNGVVSVAGTNFTIYDRAGNLTMLNQNDINGLVTEVIQADTTRPTISATSIYSSNTNTSLAKTNDTIFVQYTDNDNLSPTTSLRLNAMIHDNPITSIETTSGPLAANKFFSRFTDGTETSEEVVGFSFQIVDEAGNRSVSKDMTDDTSFLRFDRTNPIITSVGIEAISQDATAFLGDLPTYYARSGDEIKVAFEAADYVDILNPPTGTINGNVATITNISGDIWEASVLGDNADEEGMVVFDILVKDNAGNGDGTTNSEVHITGTTDGTMVFYDRTGPTLPTLILDGEGAETVDFKHRSNARFTWTGSVDLNDMGSVLGSGLFFYDVLFDNTTNGTNESAILLSDTTNYRPATPAPSDTPYIFHITDVTDKAGNKSGPAIVYTQLYTIGVLGQVTDQDGKPISGAMVQVVARYGDTCSDPSSVCTDITDAEGRYAIVTQKDRDYTLNAWEAAHYLGKAQIHVLQEDLYENISLKQPSRGVNERQTGMEVLRVVTDQLFSTQKAGEKDQQTAIIIRSYGGEFTVRQEGSRIFITSLSEITMVGVNNPAVQVINNNDNSYTIVGAGNITGRSATGNTSTSYTSTGDNFQTGTSRLGVQKTTTSGVDDSRWSGMKREDFVGAGHFWTEAESKEFVERANEGQAPVIKFYINRNGYEVFGGYVSGKMALDRFEKRAQNPVIYRDRKVATSRNKRERILSLKEKSQAMKEAYQNQYEKKSVVVASRGVRKMKNEDAAKTATVGKNYRKTYVNKFAKTETRFQTVSKLEKRSLENMQMRVGNQSVSMDLVMSGESRNDIAKKSLKNRLVKQVGQSLSEG